MGVLFKPGKSIVRDCVPTSQGSQMIPLNLQVFYSFGQVISSLFQRLRECVMRGCSAFTENGGDQAYGLSVYLSTGLLSEKFKLTGPRKDGSVQRHFFRIQRNWYRDNLALEKFQSTIFVFNMSF